MGTMAMCSGFRSGQLLLKNHGFPRVWVTLCRACAVKQASRLKVWDLAEVQCFG